MVGGGATRPPMKAHRPPPRVSRTDAPVLVITENRREILVRLFAGDRIAEIAKATGRSTSTIENTVKAIREKLGARTEYDLMRECLYRRIVTFAEIMRATRDG
jgi:DNA-binding NarL/FixJ family response regulator